MQKLLLINILYFITLSSVGQETLYPANSCIPEVFKKIGNVYLTYGSAECAIFNLESFPKDYTLLVFNESDSATLLYQVSFIAGKKQGTEMILIENEVALITYVNGKREGKSFTFYNNGKIHYERFFKNDLIKGKIKEYDKQGQLLKKLKVK